MDLVRLVYHSRCHLDQQRGSASDQIADILRVSVANNQRDDITGGLVYDRKWFIQVLEGREQAVTQAFERILCDTRHGAIALVKMQPISLRRFGSWWMADAERTANNNHLFAEYTEGGPFDPQVIPGERLLDLLDAVLHDSPSQPARQRWLRRASSVA